MKKSSVIDCLVASGVVALFFALVVPLQTYLSNRDGFPFPVGSLLPELLLAFLAVFTVLFLVLLILDKILSRLGSGWLRILPFAAVFAILVCAYLETGILSFNLPQLDGDRMNFNNAYRKVVDLVALAASGAISFGLVIWLRRYVKLFFGGILVMALASLLDVRLSSSVKTDCEMGDGLVPKYTVAKSMEYSTNRNVLVFILDSVPATTASDVLSANPDLAGKFTGFVSYRNNIGMHENTQRGLPGLMTGIYASKDDTAADYSMSMFGKDSLLQPYFKDGVATFFIGGMFEFGYCNRVKKQPATRQRKENRWFCFKRFGGVPNLSLWDVIKFRLVPFFMKHGVLCVAFAEGEEYDSVAFERALFPMLAESPLSQEKLAFALFHTCGVHPPINFDRDGSRFSEDVPDRQRLDGAAYYVLNMMGDLLETLKRRGLYDCSTILVIADHGIICMKHPEGEMGQTSAMLMVKPENSFGDFSVSDIPTSHSRIAALVKQLRDSSLDRQTIDDILHQETRLYRGRFKKSVMFYDWTYGPDGKLLKREEAGVFKGQ